MDLRKTLARQLGALAAFASTCAVALSLGALPGTAGAAALRFNFEIDFASGPLGGQTALGSLEVEAGDCPALVCNGTFTPSGPANPIVGPTGTLLAFSVVVDGITFSAADDDLFPDFPSVVLADNGLARIDFIVFGGPPSLSIYGSAAGGWGGEYRDAFFDTSVIGNLRQIGGAQLVPEPATALLLAGALLAGAATRRRRAR